MKQIFFKDLKQVYSKMLCLAVQYLSVITAFIQIKKLFSKDENKFTEIKMTSCHPS